MSLKNPFAGLKRLGARDPVFHEIGLGSEWTTREHLDDLLIVVHPGDAIEHPRGWGSREQAEQVIRLAMANQAGMAQEMSARLPHARVIVLHRESSTQFDPVLRVPWIDRDYERCVGEATVRGANLYGDDLDEAAAWILASGAIKPGMRVFMTGAYSDQAHGCITKLGGLLLAAEPALQIDVDAHSPTDNTNAAPRWDPGMRDYARRTAVAPGM